MIEVPQHLKGRDFTRIGSWSSEPAHDRARFHPLPEPGELHLGRHQHAPVGRTDVAPCGSLATVTMDAIMLNAQ